MISKVWIVWIEKQPSWYELVFTITFFNSLWSKMTKLMK